MDQFKRITDPRRLLNRDECPQFIAFCTTKGGGKRLVGAGTADRAAILALENRECLTVDMTWGLDGFAYGPGILIAREHLTESLLPRGDYQLDKVFNNQIFEHAAISSYSLIHNNKAGCQTQKSLKDAMEMLDKELRAREVPRPVVVMSDCHESRYGKELLAWCKSVGIFFFFEKPKTSGFLQALDQYNRKFHIEYNKGLREYRITEGYSRGCPAEEVNLGVKDFLAIFSTVWFNWSSKLDRITAFRRVGICTDALRPDLVNRKNFTGAVLPGAAAGTSSAGTSSAAAAPTSSSDPAASADGITDGEGGGRATRGTESRRRSSVGSAPAPPAAPFYLADKPPESPQPPKHYNEVLTPERGPASHRGTAAYWKHKAEQHLAINVQWEACVTKPSLMGALPRVVAAPRRHKKKRGRLNESYGCMDIQNLVGKATVMEDKRDAAEQMTRDNKAGREAANAAKTAASSAAATAWKVCHPTCACGVAVCPQRFLKFCLWCERVLKTGCRQQTCKDKAAAADVGVLIAAAAAGAADANAPEVDGGAGVVGGGDGFDDSGGDESESGDDSGGDESESGGDDAD
jgi:hypothetical protein